MVWLMEMRKFLSLPSTIIIIIKKRGGARVAFTKKKGQVKAFFYIKLLDQDSCLKLNEP